MPSTLAPDRFGAGSRRVFSRATRPPGSDEVTLSQELRTVGLLRPHVLVGYQSSHTGLCPGCRPVITATSAASCRTSSHSLATDCWPLATVLMPLTTVLSLHAPRPTPHQRGQVVRDLPPLATAIHRQSELAKTERAPISTSGPSIFSMSPNRAIASDKSIRFLPARRRPTVDHSLVAGGAQRQGLQTCRPDAHQPECLFSRCRLRKYSAW